MPFLDYELPSPLIAQQPTAVRDASRLMVLDRARGSIEHRRFADLPQLLRVDDLLVLNDTRVLPARIVGKRARTGGAWEGLFLAEPSPGVWELACRTRGTLVVGETIRVAPGSLTLELIEKMPSGHWLARPDRAGSPAELLADCGRMPLPPYIPKSKAEAEDAQRYQTIFAREPGAVAAPTAGLHFTATMFEELERVGVRRAFVTLHVGAGTFQPIRHEDYRRHVMHLECGELPPATVTAVEKTKRAGGRVVAVGTTSVRVLESVAATGPLRAWSGATELFIHSPYEFQVVDALVTNFHLPRSTLLLLVGAFAGDGLLREAYRVAIAEEYRFYSYGDAMIIV